ncbi:hypothetical protein IFM89_019892 [Coptis chinensis]|uniref:DUF4283 domain-containing protein n=1 Tax=Coptis chinensis TaxID=261450 RepID=A0A835I4M7_9MAGN|nr:hypothetical protein IFM89_019892 [Coptis chinensis]
MRKDNHNGITSLFADKKRGEQPHHIDVDDLPVPTIKGNMPSIKLPKKAVERGRLYCKYCLVGRLDFNKIKLDEVRSIASTMWRPQGDWKIIPLGKGFFMIRLTCEMDWKKIWGSGPWRFGDQTLRLSKWSPDFDPAVHIRTKALVWIKFPKLRHQYWDYEILMLMGKTVGYPIGVDKHTLERDFGNYASVLVDVDLSKPIPNQIWVEEEEGISFMQDIEVVKMPKFCSHCKMVGHLVAECKMVRKNIRIEEAAKEVAQPETYHAVSRGHKRRNRPHKKNKKDEGTSGTKDSNGEFIPTQELRERNSNPTILEVVDLATSPGALTEWPSCLFKVPLFQRVDTWAAQAGKSKELSQDLEMNQFPNREEGTLQGEFFDAQEAIESTLASAVRNSDESIIEGCEPTSRRDEAETTELVSSITPSSNHYRA